MTVNKEIVYPIFLECCQYATDIFWENVFEDLAYGKTPHGTYISKNFFCCNYKNKDFSYKITKTNSEQLYKDIYNLLYNRLGLLSQKEKVKKHIDFTAIEDQIKEDRKCWSSIRKKNVKDLLIENYVLEMKKKYSLTLKQAKYLLSIIFIGMVFKAITAKDIDYNDGKINNIEGIDFNKKKILLKRDIYKIEVSFSSEIVSDKKIMSDNWEKYISSLQKIANFNKDNDNIETTE